MTKKNLSFLTKYELAQSDLGEVLFRSSELSALEEGPLESGAEKQEGRSDSNPIDASYLMIPPRFSLLPLVERVHDNGADLNKRQRIDQEIIKEKKIRPN